MTNPDRLITPWYPGLTCDHIYDNCPNRQQGLRSDPDYPRWIGTVGLDPLDPDTCSMCRHRWKRKTGWEQEPLI
jgi:hypothetical protein